MNFRCVFNHQLTLLVLIVIVRATHQPTTTRRHIALTMSVIAPTPQLFDLIDAACMLPACRDHLVERDEQLDGPYDQLTQAGGGNLPANDRDLDQAVLFRLRLIHPNTKVFYQCQWHM